MGQYSSRMAFLEFGIWNSEPGFLQAQPPHPARPGWRKRRLRSTLSPKGERALNSYYLPPRSPRRQRAGGEGVELGTVSLSEQYRANACVSCQNVESVDKVTPLPRISPKLCA